MSILDDIKADIEVGKGLYVKTINGGLSLELYDQGIDDKIFEKIVALCKGKNITTLNLNTNNVTDISIKLLASHFPSLQILNLRRNYIKDEGAKELEKMHSLQELNVACNGLTQEGIQILEIAFKGKKLLTEYNPGSPPTPHPGILGDMLGCITSSIIGENREIEYIPNSSLSFFSVNSFGDEKNLKSKNDKDAQKNLSR